MPTSTSIRSYPDVAGVLQRAVESQTGVVAEFETTGEAYSFSTRANKYRQLDRKENSKIYSPDHPMHGKSVFDPIKISLKGKSVEFRNMANVTISLTEL